MNAKQREAAYRLLAAVESDPELKEEAADYGDWHSYLTQHLTDTDEDD
jgi:hypothetical protein